MYNIDYEKLINDTFNQTTGIEFSLDMTLRAFIQWFLDLPVYVVFAILLFIILGSILIKPINKK